MQSIKLINPFRKSVPIFNTSFSKRQSMSLFSPPYWLQWLQERHTNTKSTGSLHVPWRNLLGNSPHLWVSHNATSNAREMFHLTTPLEIPPTFQRQMNAERRGYWETKQQLIMAIEPWTLKNSELGKWLGSRKWRLFPGFLRCLFSGMYCKCTILQRIAGKSTMNL